MLTCNSFFSGIGGFDLGFERAGIKTLAQVEYDEKCRAVLARHFPDADRSVTDIRDARADNLPTADIWCGGFPCQDLSVAGKRKGLAGERSGLWYEFHRAIVGAKPRWVVIENVPGLLSSNDGRDFAILLGGLTGRIPAVPGDGWGSAGFVRGSFYSVAYRVLDAQFFGVAQRRRRVFIVGHLGDGRAAEVLFEPESGDRDFAPRRETGTRLATDVAASIRATGGGERGFSFDAEHGLVASALSASHGGADDNDAQAHHLVAFGGNNTAGPIDIATAQNAHGGTGRLDFESETFVTHTLRGEGHDASEDGTGRGTPLVFDWQSGGDVRLNISDQHTSALQANQTPAVLETLHTKGYNTGKGDTDASAQEANAREILRELREAVGAKSFTEWGLRVLNSLQSQEVLQSALHGGGVRQAGSESGERLDDRTLSRPEGLPAGAMRELWESGPDRRSPQGRELAQQLARELAAPLPELSPSRSPFGVRRLTPVECEKLQGFPDGWTDGQADSARYKQLGNAVAVPCAEWIGRRIMQVVNQEA